MSTVKSFLLVILLSIPAVAEDLAAPADLDVQLEPLLEVLRDSITNERWLDAAQSFDAAWQQLHDGEDQTPEVRFAGTRTLQPGQHQTQAGARVQLREIFRSAPAAFRQEYQRQYDGPARRQLQDVFLTGDRHSLLKLVRRFEFCNSASAGAAHLVADSVARGDLLNAALILNRILHRTPDPPADKQLLLADIWLRAGFVLEAEQTVRRLALRTGYGSSVRIGTQQIRLPDSPTSVADWVSHELPVRVSRDRRSTWLQPQGNESRTGLHAQQPARMKSDWQRSLFLSLRDPQLNSSLKLLEQLVLARDSDTFISPSRPIVTDELVIFQGIGNLQAVSRSTGEAVWESSLFNRQLRAAIAWTDVPGQRLAARTLDFIVHDMHRNHIRGQLVSDGHLLFCVEETSQGPISPLVEPPLHVQAQNFNVLRVYDVSTGRLLGQAGGLLTPAGSGRTDPLAATCFLGAPLLLHDRILILAEDSHGIHLLDLRLRPVSGSPDAELRFEVADRQLLSVPLFELPEHPLRRYSGVVPGFSDGLILCNSCDEQVFGVSADDLSIEWVHRYRASVRPKEIGGGNPVLGNAASDDDSRQRDAQLRPHDSLLRIRGSHILLMPRDSDQLICLNLHTGEQRWSKPRGNLRYVAALTDSEIVLAGTSRLVSVQLSDGSVVWHHEFTEAEISAQPAATDQLIYLPTRQGHVLSINAADGRRLLDQRLSDNAVGNLLSVRGQLFARSATRLHSWTPADISIDPQLAAIEESLLNSDPDTVIPRLVDFVETSGEKTAASARRLLIQQLLESVRLDYRRNLHRIPLLTRMIEADEVKPAQIAAAVRASFALTPYDTTVFAEYWDAVRVADAGRQRLDQLIVQGLATQSDLTTDEFVTQVEEVIRMALTRPQRVMNVGPVQLLAGNQTAAAIHSALSRFDEQSRIRAVNLLRESVRSLLNNRADSRFAADPLYFCWMSGLAECLLPIDELALNRIPVPTQRALVPQLLASRTAGWLDSQVTFRLLKDFWNSLATLPAEFLGRTDRDHHGPGNDALGQIADALHRREPQAPFAASPLVNTGDASTANQRPPASIEGAPKTLIPLHGTPGVYRGWQFSRIHAQPGIIAIDSRGRRRWVFNPDDRDGIRIRPNGVGQQRENYAVACGKLLALNDDGRLQMLNAAEQSSPEILWSVDLDKVLPEATEYQMDFRSWERTTVYQRQPHALAPVGPLTEFGLPLFRGQRLVVLNPWTGQQMWTEDGLPDDIRMAGSEDQLCLISESTGQIQVRNLRDGSLLRSGQLPDWWTEGNALYDTSVRHIDLEPGVKFPWRLVVEGTRCLVFTLRPEQAALTAYDLAAVDAAGPVVAWQAELPANSVFSNVCEGLIATLSNDEQLQIRQVSNGRLTVDQTVSPISECEQLYLRRSQNRLLVLTYAPDEDSDALIVGSAVPVNGPVYGIDMQDGTVAWTGQASNEYLRTLSTNRSPLLPPAPLLVLLSRKPRQTPGRLGADYAARILNVHDGSPLYEDQNLGSTLSYHSLRFDGDGRFTVNFDVRAIEFDFSRRAEKP